MSTLNRADVLRDVRAVGYKGKAELADVKSWMAENGFATTFDVPGDGDEGTTQVSIDDAWGRAATLEAKAATPKDNPPDEIATLKGKLKAAEERLRLTDHSGKAQSMIEHSKAPAARSDRERRRKAYNQKAQAGDRTRTSFADADAAEVFGAFARLTLSKMHPAEMGDYSAKADDADICKALGTTTGTLGGFLVPDEFRADLIELKEIYGVMRGVTGVTPMGRDVLMVPRLGSDVTTNWVTENSAETAQDKPTFDLVQLSAKALRSLVLVSTELMQDAALNVGDVIARSMARSMGSAEDDAAINGNGTSTYGGVVGLINGLDANAYFTSTATTWAAITWSDILNVFAKQSHINGLGDPIGLCSKQFWDGTIVPLVHAAGGQTQQERINGVNTYRAGGYNFVLCPKMPQSLPASKIAMYAGWFGAGMKFGEREVGSLMTSEDRYFEYDQIAFKMRERIDINLHELGASGSNIVIAGLKTT